MGWDRQRQTAAACRWQNNAVFAHDTNLISFYRNTFIVKQQKKKKNKTQNNVSHACWERV